jgi:hypothetical protein
LKAMIGEEALQAAKSKSEKKDDKDANDSDSSKDQQRPITPRDVTPGSPSADHTFSLSTPGTSPDFSLSLPPTGSPRLRGTPRHAFPQRAWIVGETTYPYVLPPPWTSPEDESAVPPVLVLSARRQEQLMMQHHNNTLQQKLQQGEESTPAPTSPRGTSGKRLSFSASARSPSAKRQQNNPSEEKESTNGSKDASSTGAPFQIVSPSPSEKRRSLKQSTRARSPPRNNNNTESTDATISTPRRPSTQSSNQMPSAHRQLSGMITSLKLNQESKKRVDDF